MLKSELERFAFLDVDGFLFWRLANAFAERSDDASVSPGPRQAISTIIDWESVYIHHVRTVLYRHPPGFGAAFCDLAVPQVTLVVVLKGMPAFKHFCLALSIPSNFDYHSVMGLRIPLMFSPL
jgi:hypothetical protein